MVTLVDGSDEVTEKGRCQALKQVPDTAAWPPLAPETVLYRPLTRGGMVSWNRPNPITNNCLTPLAFMRRPPHPETGQRRDVHGFSVTLANGRTENDVVFAELKYDPRAICRLTVGEARSVSGTRLSDGVVVTVEPVQDAADHANLVALPEVLEEPATTEAGRKATADAEFIGGKLAALAEVVWRKPKKM